MKQYLHCNWIRQYSKAKLFFLLIFLFISFYGFSQNINVNIILPHVLAYGNNGHADNDDGIANFPDINEKIRLVLNGVNYDYNIDQETYFDDDNPWITPEFPNYYLWYNSPIGGIAQNSTIYIELDAWEEDLIDNDASCHGYQTILPINNLTDQFPYCNTYYRDSITCSSDGTARQWGFDAFIEWQFKELFPGTIETDKTICTNYNQPILINSVTLGTVHNVVSEIWQISTDGTNWNDITYGIADGVSFSLGLLPAGSTRYVRRKKETICAPSNNFNLTVPGLTSISAPPPVYSNVCTIHVIAPPTAAPTATPSQTTTDCGSFTLLNPIDPLNNTVPFSWEFQTSLNNGVSWAAPVYSMPTIFANNTTANRNVCIRLRPIYQYNCDTAPFKSYCWTQLATPKAPTLDSIYPDPSTPLICNGDAGVWATFNPGTGGGHDEFEYTINGTTWLTYTPGQVIPVPINKDIEIRGRRAANAGTSCTTTAWSSLAFWSRNTVTKMATAVVSPSLNAKSPNTATICKGANVSATINAGTGGAVRPNDQREFSTDGGVTWAAYTSGATIVTTNAIDSVLIRIRRNDGAGTAPLYRYLCSTDWKVIAKWTVINPLSTLQSLSIPICYSSSATADLVANNPSPAVGTWSIQSGAGSLTSTSALINSVTGLTPGSPTTIRWSVTQSGCTKNLDTVITPVITSVANLTNGGLCQNCPVKNGSSYNFYDNTGKLMAKIDDLASPLAELSTTEVCVGIDTSVQKTLTNTGVLQPYLQRHFSIKPVTNTNTNVTLYFTATEFNNLKTNAAATPYAFTNVNQLLVSKFPGGGNNAYSLPNTAGGIFITPTASGFDAINGYYFITIPVSTFSTFYIHPSYGIPTVLPIELTYFTTTCESNKIKVEWQTASEYNNHHFEVERSENGSNFTSILSIPTLNGYSNKIQSYLVYDNEPKNVKSYYRLKQVDNDGQFSYSKIAAVNCQNSAENNMVVSVYPNPVEDILNVFVNASEETSVTVSIYNLNTSLVLQKQIKITKGNNLLDVSLQNITQGMYFIEINNMNGILYKNKIIKQ